jgi:uncharacterized protein YecT (DUF1311 family)
MLHANVRNGLATATAVVLGLLVSSAAGAGDTLPNIDCSKATANAELNACAERQVNKADAKLNDAYQKALAYIAKTDGDKPYDAKSWADALRTSQRAWIAYRDADCNGLIPMSWGGGTGAMGAVLGCMQTKTEARTKELETVYDEQ